MCLRRWPTLGLSAIVSMLGLLACSPELPHKVAPATATSTESVGGLVDLDTPLVEATQTFVETTLAREEDSAIELGEPCILNDGQSVADGWSGRDTGTNHCNRCRCIRGNLACTKMACQEVLEPTPAPLELAIDVFTPTPAPIPTPPDLSAPPHPIMHGPDPSVSSVKARGPFDVASIYQVEGQKDGPRDGPHFAGATIYYPVSPVAPLSSIVIVPGWAQMEDSIAAWGPFYASHGIVTMTIGTNDVLDGVQARSSALLDAIDTLRQEQSRIDSPLMGRLDVSRISVSGWSMGGGAAQRAAVESSSLKAVIALCPWRLSEANYQHRVPLLIFTGSEDQLASTLQHGLWHYQMTPDETPKLLVEIDGGGHRIANGPNEPLQGTDVVTGDVGSIALAWLKTFVDRDPRYRVFLSEEPVTASMFVGNLR